MEYGIHLMFGSDFKKSLLSLKQYVEKYGSNQTASYIRTILWEESKNKDEIIISEVIKKPYDINKEKFTAGIEKLFNVEIIEKERISSDNRDDHIQYYFQRLFDETINLDTVQDSISQTLHLYLYIPLYEKGSWDKASKIIELVKALPITYQIDVIGLATDLAHLFTDQPDNLPKLRLEHSKITAYHIHKIVAYKKEYYKLIKNFILFQNYSSQGLSLNLNLESYTKIIGELACLWTQYYNRFFVSTSELKAVGLSMVSFDRYYFVQYLLSRTYIQLMENARINEEEININEVTQITKKLLKDETTLINDFWNSNVAKKLADGSSIESLIPEIDADIKTLISELSTKLEAFLYAKDSEYSLPKKKAILANLLGLDDELIEGNQFQDNQLIVDDLQTEGCLLFINANNEILDSDHPKKAILSNNGEPIKYPLPEIKRLRDNIKLSTTFIRRKEKELAKLTDQISDSKRADKRLTEDGKFIYEGNRFKLLPNTIEEFPLEETYVPVKVDKYNIDLREHFTAIKNQGEQGACSAFTLIGIYEYILKTNNNLDTNLSEAFLYYNARKRSNCESIDAGSNFYDAILAFAEYGSCKETLFPYNDKSFNIEPPEEAYTDARNNLVKKAKNVTGGVDSIRSAISEGYPVAISLKIFNSFGNGKNGFIYRPTSAEIQSNEFGNHAMIICGYSDNEKVFLVRNSWGNSFGDKGYCYIPYSYINDDNLMNGAFIITEITSTTKITPTIFGKINFDTTDANILHAIVKIQLEEEKILLAQMQQKDSNMRRLHLELISKLRHPRNRNILIEGKKEYLKTLKTNINKNRTSFMDNMSSVLQQFTGESIKWNLVIGMVILMLTGTLITIFANSSFSEFIESTLTQVLIGATIVSVITCIIYNSMRSINKKLLKKEQKETISDYTSRIYNIEKEIELIEIKHHLAGEILERLFNLEDELKNRYHIIESYLGNLKIWRKEELEKRQNMTDVSKEPFTSIIKNEVLDYYFDEHKDSIIKNTSLTDFITQYKLNEEEIVTFKKNLKEGIITTLLEATEDFTMLDYTLNKKQYSYLSNQEENIIDILPVIDKKSNVFVQLNLKIDTLPPHKLIAVFAQTDDMKKEWEAHYDKAFSNKPQEVYINNPLKLIVANIKDIELGEVLIAQNK